MGVLTSLKGLSQPTAATQAASLSLNGPGPISSGDMIGSAKLETQELINKLNLIIRVTDANDPNLATLQAQVTALS